MPAAPVICEDWAPEKVEKQTGGQFTECMEVKDAGWCDKSGPMCKWTCGTCAEGACADWQHLRSSSRLRGNISGELANQMMVGCKFGVCLRIDYFY